MYLRNAYAMLVFIIHAFLLTEKGSQEAEFSVYTHLHSLANEKTFIVLAINNHFCIAITLQHNSTSSTTLPPPSTMPKIVFQDPIYDMRAPRTPRRKSHDWEREVRRQNLVGSFSSWLKQHTAPKKSKRRSSAARRDLVHFCHEF